MLLHLQRPKPKTSIIHYNSGLSQNVTKTRINHDIQDLNSDIENYRPSAPKVCSGKIRYSFPLMTVTSGYPQKRRTALQRTGVWFKQDRSWK